MTDAIVRFDNVHLRRGARVVLAGAAFEAGRGEVVALMGSSGSGKTTILRTLAGLETFEQGAVTLDEVTLEAGVADAAAVRALRRKVGMVFQFHCLFEHLSALQNVALALVHVQRLPAREAEQRSRELLATLGVDHRAAALPRELSGGEAQRVAIARALAMDPPVLLLDEPTASLDPARRGELVALLASLAGRRRTLIVATHDEDFARDAATRVLRVLRGRIS
jgi:polar amino acid transport system ATP-binding protein